MSEPDNTPREKIDQLIKKADRLSDFGTLTSLISTATYIFENTFVKKLPKWLSITTLSAVGVGIASVISSYYYKFRAGRLALDASQSTSVAPGQICVPPAVPQGNEERSQKWSKGRVNAPPASDELRR